MDYEPGKCGRRSNCDNVLLIETSVNWDRIQASLTLVEATLLTSSDIADGSSTVLGNIRIYIHVSNTVLDIRN